MLQRTPEEDDVDKSGARRWGGGRCGVPKEEEEEEEEVEVVLAAFLEMGL
jgi:hypothetical protein